MKSFSTPVRSTFCVRLAFFVCLIIGGTTGELRAQEEDVIELTLHARPVPANPDLLRLLPRELEMRDGNAAIELLRMPWEQQNFMELERKMMGEWEEMEGDNPELLKYESAFEVFKNKMRRAAYTRDADWDYPIGEQPLPSILLPDVQGMRNFVGRVMSLWIRVQISKGNLEGAHEGLLIQMACARHICRTPFTVCHLVGNAISRIGFTQLENLIQNRDSENYFHALSMLPETLGDFNAAMDIEATLIRGSMPSIAGTELPPPGDVQWKVAFDEFVESYISSMSTAADLDRVNLLGQSSVLAEELPRLTGLADKEVKKMSREEICSRWLIAHSDRLGAKYVAAIQLPKHLAIQEFVKLENEVDKLKDKTVPEGAAPIPLFNLYSPRAFMGCHRFGRDAKLLQIVEAIRHHAGVNENRLPESLSDIELALPTDPFTGKPAEYEMEDGVATLRWPLIENLEEQRGRTYKLKMATSK